jgi:hypothetical protein
MVMEKGYGSFPLKEYVYIERLRGIIINNTLSEEARGSVVG